MGGIPENLADKMVETKIWNVEKTLRLQAFTRITPEKAGIQIFFTVEVDSRFRGDDEG